MTDGEARTIHERRLLEERLADEARREPITLDVEKWRAHPERFDVPRVDEPGPLRFEKRERYSAINKEHTGVIDGYDKDGNNVGTLVYYRKPCDMYVATLLIEPPFFGKGYAPFLLREAANIQDSHCIPATIEPHPFGPHDVGRITPEEWERHREMLKKFYGSFGFEPWHGREMRREAVCGAEGLDAARKRCLAGAF